MKKSSCHNVTKHKEIKGSAKYTTLDISLKFDSLDNTRITYLESQEKLGISGKGLVKSLGLKAKSGIKKSKGMPLDISARNIFQRLLVGLKNHLMKVI